MNVSNRYPNRQAPSQQPVYRQPVYQPYYQPYPANYAPSQAIPYEELCGESCEQCIKDSPDPRADPGPGVKAPAASVSGLPSLVNGNNTGAVRGINTASGYVMGENAMAVGANTQASGAASFAEGLSTSANNQAGAHIMGRFGAADAPYSWFLANGTSGQAPGLAAKILGDGNAYIDGSWFGGGADYAELFESVTGQPIEPGYFVTFAGASDKIRIANASDEYILGVVSRTAGFVAGAGELRWKNKYKTDEWGGVVYEDAAVPEERDGNGNILVPKHTESRPVLNPAFDPGKTYVPRESRPEWVRVGLLGAVLVRDDGSLTPGGYCRADVSGTATAAHTGYRVLRRTAPSQALILFR